MAEEVRNRQVILKNYVSGIPNENAMDMKIGTINLRLPNDSSGELLVKNLYLSCDPYMVTRMRELQGGLVEAFTQFTLGSVRHNI